MELARNFVTILATFFVLVGATAALQNETSFGNSSVTATYISCNETEENEACLSGGRMYQLLASLESGNPQILDMCISECTESYGESLAQHACEVGCRAEESVVADRQRKLADYEAESNSLIQRTINQQILSQWMLSMIAGFDLFNEWYDSNPADDGGATYLFIEQSDRSFMIRSYRVADRPVLTTSDAAESMINPYIGSDDGESCYMQGTYSRLALCLLLFSSTFYLIWLTCSTVSTAPRHSKPQSSAQLPEDKKALLKLMDQSPASVHYPKKCTDDDEKMLIA